MGCLGEWRESPALVPPPLSTLTNLIFTHFERDHGTLILPGCISMVYLGQPPSTSVASYPQLP